MKTYFFIITTLILIFLNVYETCQIRTLSRSVTPPNPPSFTKNMTKVKELPMDMNISSLFRILFDTHPDIAGAIIHSDREQVLALNLNGSDGLKIFSNRTAETGLFWDAVRNSIGIGWGRPFKDCHYFMETWFYVWKPNERKTTDMNQIGLLFYKMDLDRCLLDIAEIFGEVGSPPCDNSQLCINGKVATETEVSYQCICRPGFYYPGATMKWTGLGEKLMESGKFNQTRCHPCPPECPVNCAKNDDCLVEQDQYLEICIIIVQLVTMGFALCLAIVVFKQRKTKAIASGMWTILEIILLGVIILYSTVIIRSRKPSIMRCLLEPWIREIGFIICYGAIILKLYRHLIEFRTRKAHRWVVKDTDLLKYLLIMVVSGLAYMAAFTALTLNFISENYSILDLSHTSTGRQFMVCKYLWWDYVTEVGEMAILVFGLHLAYASRNARTQFHERSFLCAAVSLELAISFIFYTTRITLLPNVHPDLVLIIYCIRSQISQTISLILVFLPKFWYQHKQIRSLGQEYSCRFPLDAFKDPPSQRSLSGNNSDVEIGEISIADMNPDDIRAELKRLYLQLEMFKAKTICRDNPHISKRRGGRKAQLRRFSLQKKGSKEKVRRTMSLHTRQKKDNKRDIEMEITEAEPSRTPEESVCSTEGPSTIYADLPSTNQILQ